MKSDLLSDSMESLLGFATRNLRRLSECNLDCAVENMDIWATLIIIIFGVIAYCCPKNLFLPNWVWRKFKKDD